jgi:OOP family OmpA-OmpF porin
MKKLILLAAMLSFVVASEEGYKMIKVVEDATSSNASKEIEIPEYKRPAGLIIREAKDDIPEAIVSTDDDMDGVLNDKDECPDTPKGKVVDDKGCIKLIRLQVNFAFDKYNLEKEYEDEIQEAVRFVEENRDLTVSVDGHTDAIGTEEYNMALSLKRADTVADKLKNSGVSDEKIKIQGFGESMPIQSNETEDGRAQNRRVDISFNK